MNSPWVGTIRWTRDVGLDPDIHHIEIISVNAAGAVVVWSVVMPGSETQIALPPTALAKLRNEDPESPLFLTLSSSRSAKFTYSRWTYESLNSQAWSSYTSAYSENFRP
ncbi:MAG: hypothetical protein ACT4TC_07730 [Myxococcaceae bacterium]